MMLRTYSHRARQKVEHAINRKPAAYWTWETAGTLIEVTADEYEIVRHIKGLTKYNGKALPMPCWPMGAA